MGDDELVRTVEIINKCLGKVNPLGYLLDKEDITNIIIRCENPLNFDNEEKSLIKRKFVNWCRKHHPDKTDNVEGEMFYIYKEFCNAFLRFQETEYENVWMYMCYALVSFNNFDVSNVTINDLFRVDCDVLLDIINSSEISPGKLQKLFMN